MTTPLPDERLAEILAHAPNCRYGCVACESTPELVAEIRRLRGELGRALERPTHPAFERLRRERDQANGKLAAVLRTVARVAETRDRATTLLRQFVDDEPCLLDHHGYCQNHGLSPTPCRNAEARRLLGVDASGGDVEAGGTP